jgi:hypothetical protein
VVVCRVVAWRRRNLSWHCPILIWSSLRSALAVTLRAACPLAVVKRRREGGVTNSCLHLWLNVQIPVSIYPSLLRYNEHL